MDGLGPDAAVVQVLDEVAALGREGEGAEAQDGAGGADDALVAALDDLIDVGPDRRLDVLHQPALVAVGQRIGAHEALGQPDDADLEALRERGVMGACRA